MRGGPIERMNELSTVNMNVEAENYTDVWAVAFKNPCCSPEMGTAAVGFLSVVETIQCALRGTQMQFTPKTYNCVNLLIIYVNYLSEVNCLVFEMSENMKKETKTHRLSESK